MRVPVSWLRDFAPFEGPVEEIAHALDDLGLVVEGMERVGTGLEGVVVARVLATRPHPGADRVQLVDVEAGAGPVQVVCGAFNFGPGDLVPLATTGTTLPTGMEVGRRKVRGEWSEGMLCAPDELGLGDDHAGILVLPPGFEPGTPVRQALGVEADTVLDVYITPNRPDAMSMAGIARDLAAQLRIPFGLPEVSVAEGGVPAASQVSVVVEAADLCPRFTARVISGVTVGPSPDWIARRLTLAGMRPINNVVDASNYVMLEFGQPSHPYDTTLLAGPGLLVRRAARGETLLTLDGIERRLGDGDDCLICDADGAPVGVGGVIGGASSEISDRTTTVLLEAAYFTPMAIARTAKRLGVRTEASARFERGCDPAAIEMASARVCTLMGTGQVAPGLVDVAGDVPGPRRLRVRVAKVNSLLGTSLTSEEIRGHLDPIGFTTSPASDGSLDVVVPTFRPDATGEVDVIEEVARHHGYRRIPRTTRPNTRTGQLTPYQRDRRRLRDVLAGLGISEAWTSSFLAPGDHARAGLAVADLEIELENPLVHEESVLRTSMLPGLLRALAYNAAHQHPDVRLFEVGRVFMKPPADDQLPHQPEQVCVVLAGPGDDAAAARRVWDVIEGAFRLRDVVLEAAALDGLHPTRSATIVTAASGGPIGTVGEVDPAVVDAFGVGRRVGWLQVDLVPLLAEVPRHPKLMRPVSRFPASDIDLAFVVNEATAAGQVEATLRQAAGDLLVDLALFDVYRGEPLAPGERSLAWRLRFQALDRTLLDEEVQAVRRRCIEAVESGHPARLRG